MNLLDIVLVELVKKLGLNPKKACLTRGGEWHSPCPACGGSDRFIVWPQQDRYWCRQCNRSGDAIQFCRDFLGMDYLSACAAIGAEPRVCSPIPVLQRPVCQPERAKLPPAVWQEKAGEFVHVCHEKLIADPFGLQVVQRRGLSLDTIQTFALGWNHEERFVSFADWGMSQALREDGTKKKLWLPKGIVIPTLAAGRPIKLKIRRSDWTKIDKLPKYVEVSGSMKCPSFYENAAGRPIILVEAELDAMLVQQCAGDLCACVAIGGTRKRHDATSDETMKASPLILFALDWDEAGKTAYAYWRAAYGNLRPWPVPKEKSPGDAYLAGIDLRKWVSEGMRQYQNHGLLTAEHTLERRSRQ